MQAGGPTSGAKLLETRIERGKETLWGGEQLQEAIAQGRTLDALNVQAGDRIEVPEKGGGTSVQTTESWFRIVSLVITLPIAIFGLFQFFKR
jgi:hypothetical protein